LRIAKSAILGYYWWTKSSGMKRTSLILGIALTLSSSTANLRAGGCCGFWPFLPLAFAGIAIASAASAHSSPTYVYAPPPYPYGYPYGYPQPHAPSQQPAQVPSGATAPAMSPVEQASHWVPSSPGAGHWVPDPTPYVYQPVAQNKLVATSARPATQLVTVNQSAGHVPVYTVTP
jgi:hypothetical protein